MSHIVRLAIACAALLAAICSATAEQQRRVERLPSPPGFDRVQIPPGQLSTPRGNWKPQPVEEVQWDYTPHTMNQPPPPMKGWW